MIEDTYAPAFRPNFEALASFGWVVSAGASALALKLSGLPSTPFTVMVTLSIIMATVRGERAWRNHRRKVALRGADPESMGVEALRRHMMRQPEDGKPSTIYLGRGFDWDQPHTERTHEILSRPKHRDMINHERMGAPWIHGLEEREEDIDVPISHTKGHTLIVGASGAGKTTLLRLLVTQAVLRREAVLIIDPKGDKDLEQAAKQACIEAGEPERYVYFHPTHPEAPHSVRINPLFNYHRLTELAARLAGLQASGPGSEPFQAFGHMSVHNVMQGLEMTRRRPTIVEARRYLEGSPADLVIRATEAYCIKHVPNWHEQSRSFVDRTNDTEGRARGMMKYYFERVQPDYPSSDLEGLLSLFAHNREHLQKMIASLLPLFTSLTAGSLGQMLSPDSMPNDDERPITDAGRIIRTGKVAYIGLDSLADPFSGANIGSLILSDLAAVASDRYNFGVGLRPVSIFVDELHEVLNDPFIQLGAKGRGSLLHLTVATQTYGDVIARLGSEAKARQVLGNMNNTIVMRVLDAETQKYITDGLPETRVSYIMHTQGNSSNPNHILNFASNQGERLMKERVPLLPSALLGMLPNGEYIAKVSGNRIVKGRVPMLTMPGAA